ncbi:MULTISPECIES: hypothetical protein [Aeromonas]|uniref:hypothetical protein n=1 Tax=Aeromonas TaxID=642 RepID=UPI001F3E2E5D|nr:MULTISPECIES: hypothetical protein [Aeromonas]
MARTDARLELQKARKASAALELNPLMVQRYAAVLRGTSLPPSLTCSPGLVLPSALQGTGPAPQASLVVTPVYPAALLATAPPPAVEIGAAVVIEATLASTARPPLPAIEAGHDINVFRGPSHTSAAHFERAGLVTRAVQSDWQRPELVPATRPSTWQEARPLQAEWAGLAEQLPREDGTVRVPFDEGQALGASNGHGFDSLPPGHAVTRSLWVEGAPVGRWQVSGFRNPPRQDKVWQPGSWQQGAPQGATLGDQRWQLGLPLHKGWLSRWEEAMQPPLGDQPAPQSAHQAGAARQTDQGAGVRPPPGGRLPGVRLVWTGSDCYPNPEGLSGEQHSKHCAGEGWGRYPNHLAEHRTRYRLLGLAVHGPDPAHRGGGHDGR